MSDPNSRQILKAKKRKRSGSGPTDTPMLDVVFRYMHVHLNAMMLQETFMAWLKL